MTTNLIVAGRLAVPLFHGTSSLFIRSIIEYGLGAKNPIDKYKVIRTLNTIVDLINIQHGDNLDWITSRWMYERMIQQSSSERANWQHGDVYLTPVESKAVNYARSNRYGSELISETFSLLEKYLPETNLNRDEHPLLELEFEKARPMVIRIDSILIDYLAPECAKSLNRQMEEIATGIENPMFQGLWSQMNFRLIHPLGKEFFRVVEIDEAGDHS